jgi:hypothetical protein
VVVPTSQEKFAFATAPDPFLVMVKEFVKKGWTKHKKNFHLAAKPFWIIRSELSECCGIFLKGQQIVVPKVLQSVVLLTLCNRQLTQTVITDQELSKKVEN